MVVTDVGLGKCWDTYIGGGEVDFVVVSRIIEPMVVPVFDPEITPKVDRSGSTGRFRAELDVDIA